MKTINERPQRRWTRSRDGWLAGVCEGLGQNFGIEPWLLRTIWIFSVLFFGLGLIFYVALAISLPKEDQPEAERILGVCYRIHLRTNLDLGLVRFLALLSALSSLGATIVGYIVLHFVLSENPPVHHKNKHYQ